MVVLAMLVSACTAVAPSGGESAAAPSSEPVKIVFYQRGYVEGGTDAGSVNTAKAIEVFEQNNPDIDVEVVGIPWTAEGDTKLETALAGGTDINVFRVTSPNLPRYAKQGILSEITPYLTDEDKADFYESAFQVATVDGKVWAWPLWVTAISLFANTDILAERGVEPPTMDDPWTWDEFVDAAMQLTYTKDDGTQVYGFTASSKWGAVEYYPLMYIDGGRILSADGTQFVQNQPEGVSALDKLASLALEHKVTPPDFGTVDQAGVRAQFKDNQTVALLMSTPGFIPDLEGSELPVGGAAAADRRPGQPGHQWRVRPLRRGRCRGRGEGSRCAQAGELSHRQPGGDGCRGLAVGAGSAPQQYLLCHDAEPRSDRQAGRVRRLRGAGRHLGGTGRTVRRRAAGDHPRRTDRTGSHGRHRPGLSGGAGCVESVREWRELRGDCRSTDGPISIP
jgi:ABC-type glycerol-3-phosphate transport system substrate-binding protein